MNGSMVVLGMLEYEVKELIIDLKLDVKFSIVVVNDVKSVIVFGDC